MKNKTRLTLIGSIFLLLVLAVSCTSTPTVKETPTSAPVSPVAQPKPTYSWKLGLPFPAGDTTYPFVTTFVDEVKKASGGRMNIKVYPVDELGPWDWAMEQVAMGTIEFECAQIPTTLDPRLNIASIPYMTFSIKGQRDAFATSPEGWVITPIKNIFKEVGWTLLATAPIEAEGIIAVKKFDPTPQAVKAAGIKLRSGPTEARQMAMKALGFLPIPMAWTDGITGMSTGVVDGTDGASTLCAGMFVDIAHYIYNYRYNVGTQWIVMNQKLFNSLSAEDQQIVLDAGKKSDAWGWATYDQRIKQIVEDAKKITKETGWTFEIIDLTPEQMSANVKAVREQVWPKLEGLLGKNLMDLVKAHAE